MTAPAGPPTTPRVLTSVKAKVTTGVIAGALGGAAIAGGAVNSCQAPVPVEPPGTTIGTNLPPDTLGPGTTLPDTPGTDVHIPEGSLPPDTDPPTTPVPPETTTTTMPPSAQIAAGASWQTAIAHAQPGDTLTASPGFHGTQNLTSIDAKGVTITCAPGATVGNVRLSTVSHLTVQGCPITPKDDRTIAVYVINGGGDLHFDRLTITGGERGLLTQNERSTPAKWTDGVWFTRSSITTPRIDATATYGGRNIHIDANHIVMSTLGCSVEHQDGSQINAGIGVEVTNNLIENNGVEDPTAANGETCPPDATHTTPWFVSDQGVVSTQADAGLDQATDVLIEGNTILRWRSGFSILVDGNRATNVRIIGNTIGCSLRSAPKVTGPVAGVTVSGNLTTTDC